MSTKITRVHARQVIDSRGNPTVEADVLLDGERLAVPPFLPALPPGSTRPSSSATVTNQNTLARAC